MRVAISRDNILRLKNENDGIWCNFNAKEESGTNRYLLTPSGVQGGAGYPLFNEVVGLSLAVSKIKTNVGPWNDSNRE